ncbi:unnamed protein product [Mytilus coruscus]|uniref:Uncharacterized protein n=1 Tax=Mytilus coruscus TaxID=42192 RepID=A0A6J8AH83_MYTCO|nr:unnamed protein product [Mytilus coruscus]
MILSKLMNKLNLLNPDDIQTVLIDVTVSYCLYLLHNIVQFIRQGLMSVILFQSYGRTALMLAAGGGHVEVCQLLLENRCEKDITDRDGKTALHLAAEEGHPEVTIYLVEQASISPLIKTHKGKTSYDLAAAVVLNLSYVAGYRHMLYNKVMEYLEVDDTLASSFIGHSLIGDDTITSSGTKHIMLDKLTPTNMVLKQSVG